MAHMRIYKEFKFDAAHCLTQVEKGHKCGNLHGHTFILEVHLEGEIDPDRGWILDFNVLREAVDPIIDRLDHSVLNDIEEIGNPTSENLCVWFWKQLKPKLPQLCQVVIKENASCGCVYVGD